MLSQPAHKMERDLVIRQLVVVLGVPIDNLSMAETLDRLENFVTSGRTTGKSHQVATVNADFVVKAMSDPELRYLLQESDMALADGMPLVWGGRLLGVSMAERVAGSDLIPRLAERAADCGYSIYLLGAEPGVSASAAEILQEQYPGLKIVGIQSPPYSSVLEMDPAIIEDIKAADPDILLVAFGNPKQEKWIGMHRRELSVPVMIGVGATLDFIAGHRKRAPKWMQIVGLEWFHRLVQEPRRLWRRYVVDLVAFSAFFIRQWWIMRRGFKPVTLLPVEDAVVVNNTAILTLRGRLTVENYRPFYEIGQRALHTTSTLVINMAQAEFLDSSAIGLLIELARQARSNGGELWLASVPAEIERTLSILRLDKFFVFSPTVEHVLEQKGIFFEAEAAPAVPTVETTADQAVSGPAWAVLKLPRRLDAQTAPDVLEQCQAALAQNPHLILDLTETVFLASAGLAVLARLNREAKEMAGELRMANCAKDVLKVIQMVRFDKILALFDDIPSASA